MRDAGNKEVMAKNLRFYMDEKNVTARDISRALHFPYTTIVSWINGENYPRIDKIDAMADYFGVMKSDLIEEKKEPTVKDDGLSEKQKKFMQFAESVPDDKVDQVIQAMQSILEVYR